MSPEMENVCPNYAKSWKRPHPFITIHSSSVTLPSKGSRRKLVSGSSWSFQKRPGMEEVPAVKWPSVSHILLDDMGWYDELVMRAILTFKLAHCALEYVLGLIAFHLVAAASIVRSMGYGSRTRRIGLF